MMDPDHSVTGQLARAADRLGGRRRLLVITGAGSSADAGVPTFRDADGLWQRYRVEDLASRQAFARDPELVWRWYRERREQVAACQPHAGQRSLALLQRCTPAPRRVLVATTNEDDLLERAAVADVVHLHGSLYDTACAAACGWRSRDSEDNGLSFLPCPRCGAPVRPGSVWFGEPLPADEVERIEGFAADACLVVGSSSLVQPVAAIAPEMLLAGHPVVEINATATPLSGMDGCLSLRGSACEILPALIDLMTSSLMRSRSSTAIDPTPPDA